MNGKMQGIPAFEMHGFGGSMTNFKKIKLKKKAGNFE